MSLVHTTVKRPDLTPEEHQRRMGAIKKAAAKILICKEQQKNNEDNRDKEPR